MALGDTDVDDLSPALRELLDSHQSNMERTAEAHESVVDGESDE